MRIFLITVLLAATACVAPSPPPLSVRGGSSTTISRPATLFPVIYTLDIHTDGPDRSEPKLNDSLSRRWTAAFAKQAPKSNPWKTVRRDTLFSELNQVFRQVSDHRKRWLNDAQNRRKSRIPVSAEPINISERLRNQNPEPIWLFLFVHDQVYVPKSTIQQFQQDINEAAVDNIARIILAAILTHKDRENAIPSPLVNGYSDKLLRESKIVSGNVSWDSNLSATLIAVEADTGKLRWFRHIFKEKPGFSLAPSAPEILYKQLINGRI